MRRRRPVRALAIALLATWAAAAAAADPSVDTRGLQIEIEESLVCQCGCGLTVHACNHLNCPSGIPMKEEIAKRLAAGENPEQILAYFRNKYGEKVLSAPTLSGFNLVAWITPFVFLAVGGIIVVRVARRWLRETEEGTESPAASPPAAPDDPDRKRLLQEIEEFDS